MDWASRLLAVLFFAGLAFGLIWVAKRLAVGALMVLVGAVATGIALFKWAAENAGAIGIMLYVIVWAVAMPIMIVVCIVGGILRYAGETASESNEASGKGPAQGNPQVASNSPGRAGELS